MGDLSSAEILRLTREYGLYEWAAQKAVQPLSVDRARGVHFWTVDGKRFLDFNSQLMCVNIGHGDARVLTAIREQAEKLTYVMPHLVTEPRAKLHQLLAEVSPGALKRSFLTLSGAEANEHAVKIARLVTQRQKILVCYRSYHGATAFEDNVLYAGLTYGAHPVSCAAAVATIKVYQEDGLLELVKNRQTREPLAPFNATAAELGPMAQLGAFFRDNGLFTLVRWNTFFVNPPLCISEEQLREGLAIIDRALDITDAAVPV